MQYYAIAISISIRLQRRGRRNLGIEQEVNAIEQSGLATGKKITRPSDDPVIAIRSLRLRTSLTEINQYYKKNVPDADNWLKITENAVSTTIDLITNMYSDCTSGSEGFKTSDDRSAVLGDLKGLRDFLFQLYDHFQEP